MKIIHKKPIWLTAITTLSFIVVIMFTPTSCNKYENFDDDRIYINAKVENAPEYNDVVEVIVMGYKVYGSVYTELARGKWKDGGFKIALPKNLDSNYLRPLIIDDKISGHLTSIIDTSTVIINNKNVKIGNITFWGVNKHRNVVASFRPIAINEDGNSSDAVFSYADADVTISGYTEREGIIHVDIDEQLRTQIHYLWLNNISTTYAVEWNEGWNIWSISSISNNQERSVSMKWSMAPANEIKWYGSKGDLWMINTNRK